MSETSRVLLETANRLLAENNKLLLQRIAELEADAARWRNAHDEIMKYAAGVEEKAKESIAECASELYALREDKARLDDMERLGMTVTCRDSAPPSVNRWTAKTDDLYSGQNLREVIDAAKKAER